MLRRLAPEAPLLWQQHGKRSQYCRILLVLVSCLVLSGLTGCAESPAPYSRPAGENNPKLDSALNELSRAAKRGEASAFAQQRNIPLIDGKVRVVIECLPGKTDVVAKASESLSTIETSYGDLLQVVVPIDNLVPLANLDGVKFVRLPQRPLPDSSQDGRFHIERKFGHV